MKSLYLLALILVTFSTQAQKFTISGSIKDQNSGENLIGAAVYNLRSGEGTSANNYSFYSITQSKDSIHLRISFVGYESRLIKFFLSNDTTIQIGLSNGTTLNEV